MQEIKFRAWDKEQQCMVSWEQLMDVKYNERWFIDNTDKNYINCIFSDQDYKLMQFTGLLDKSGKEIYEGDKIYVREMPASPDEKDYEDTVIFNKGCFIMAENEHCIASSSYECPDNGYKPITIEVIGNIHENKELLKEV